VKATVRRTENTGYAHDVEIRGHKLVADEPATQGGTDQGPTPQELLAASLAACTAITLEMYAERKGWDIGQIEVECEYSEPPRGDPTHFELAIGLPNGCTSDQIERLRRIAAKCPVHRTLAGDVRFAERVVQG
jgi:putative redox protein